MGDRSDANTSVAVPSTGPVLALDFGDVRTGVAVCDELRTIARPLDAIPRASSPDGMAAIATLVRDHHAVCVVVGLPVGLSGPTPQTARTTSFVGRLKKAVDGVPVVTFDERFTSIMADRTRAQTHTQTGRDSLAACHLLSAWMDSHT